MDILGNWPSSHTGSLSYVIKAIQKKGPGRNPWNSSPLPTMKVNQKLYHIHGRSSEIGTTIKNIEGYRGVDSYYISFFSLPKARKILEHNNRW